MSTELDRPIMVVSPRTGEVIAIDASIEDLGGYLADVREHESLLREAKNLVQGEVLRRMDAGASWTVNAAGLKLSGTSPAPIEEWDGAELRERLLELVDKGDLSITAVDAAVEMCVTYKVRKAGINQLRKVPASKAIVDELAEEFPAKRYVKVERA